MSAEVAETVRRYPAVRSIVINNTFKLAPWADMLIAVDARWWEKYHPETDDFPLKVCAEPTPYADVLYVRHSGSDGFDPDPAFIRLGGNGGYAAIHIAAHTGCDRILLCGFNMHGGHWHERHEYPLRDHGEGIFAKWLQRMATLAAPLAERGIEIINCTPSSALKVWPYVPLEEALG
jgi:hypothetical protein